MFAVKGRITAGRGDWSQEKTMTLAAAEALCAATTKCDAITFQGKPDPTGALALWLTSKTGPVDSCVISLSTQSTT